MYNENEPGLDEMKKDLKKAKAIVGAMIFHIETIKETGDVETIEISILCIEEAVKNMPARWRGMEGNVKRDIRDGLGDYKAIQEKCIALGVV